MKYKIEYSSDAEKSIKKIRKSAPQVYNKLRKLIVELIDHPRTGTGHVEQLKGGGGNIYSRHIAAHHRLIYEVLDDVVVVTVISIEGHYDDK